MLGSAGWSNVDSEGSNLTLFAGTPKEQSIATILRNLSSLGKQPHGWKSFGQFCTPSGKSNNISETDYSYSYTVCRQLATANFKWYSENKSTDSLLISKNLAQKSRTNSTRSTSIAHALRSASLLSQIYACALESVHHVIKRAFQ
jgi:hypothetical protein